MRRLVFLLLCLMAPIARGAPTLAERDLDELLSALSHPNPAVRMDVVDELGRRREARALVPLLRMLGDAEAGVRAHAAEALRALGDERAVPWVSRLLEDPDDTVRCRAVLALGDLGGRYVLPSLILRLSDPATVVRAAAVRALGEIGDPLSLDRVVATVAGEEDDADGAVASAALIAAAKIGGPAGLDRVLAAVGEKLAASWLLRASTAHAAGIAGDAGKEALLLTWLEGDADYRVCEAAAAALGRLGAQAPLVSALSSGAPFRRRAAIAGLDRIEGAEVDAHFVEAARDKDPRVVLEAASALLRRGRHEAFPVVIGLMDGDAPVTGALNEDAVVWLAALGVLELRTGLRFGRNVARWRQWYADRREHLTLDPATGVYEGVE